MRDKKHKYTMTSRAKKATEPQRINPARSCYTEQFMTEARTLHENVTLVHETCMLKWKEHTRRANRAKSGSHQKAAHKQVAQAWEEAAELIDRLFIGSDIPF